ncbi:DUF3231 family protein [Risungbinella massiliensis]|uniref:DUF3231 family protein n=1 Tax=Risungbinella massiliensis TaxID=1329796 RepID=UPI0005CBF1EC|nr:DUF3231 family protein [Risungbinella massiliensis]
MGVFTGNPKNQPIHLGEAFDLYSALVVAQGTIAGYQLYYNHTGDNDLRDFLQDIIRIKRDYVKQLQEPLKANGILLPPAPAERSNVDLDMIPAGARLTDPEIAIAVQTDITAALVATSQAMGKAIREDLAMMYNKMHQQAVMDGARLLELMKQKNWVVPLPTIPEVKEVEVDK